MKKNINLNWKRLTTLIIFYALFAYTFFLQAQAAEQKNVSSTVAVYETDSAGTGGGNQFSQKLAEVLLKAKENEKSQQQLLLGAAGALTINATQDPSDKINIDILDALKKNISKGKSFVTETLEFCSIMDSEVNKLSVPEKEKVKLQVRIDELRSAAKKFGLSVSSQQKKSGIENCCVLEVNDNLKVVILSAGFLDGVRVGLIWTIKNAENPVIQTIAVRDYISAAVVIKGNFEKIIPGTPAVIKNALEHTENSLLELRF